MPRNVEIKARVDDWQALTLAAEKAAGGGAEKIEQRDIFYKTPKGRLKMRFFNDGKGELNFSERPDSPGAQACDYHIHATDHPATLHGVLASSPGIAGEVVKTRYLYMLGQTRLHLDQVENLGNFMELEVVLQEDQSEEDGRRIAEEIYQHTLGLDPSARVAGAYFDLLKTKG
jgi:adenylate cyclase class IV